MVWVRQMMDLYNFVSSPFLLPVVKVKAGDKKQSISFFPLKMKRRVSKGSLHIIVYPWKVTVAGII